MKWAIILLASSVLLLTLIGLVMIFSVSSVEGERIYNDGLHFVKNQGIFFLLAVITAVIIYTIPLETWFSKGMVYIFISIIVFGLIAVHIPGLGKEVKGSSRWIQLPGIRLQTSEFIKIATIFLMAWWQGLPWSKNKTLAGTLIPCAGLGIVCIGLLLQPDFGSAIMLSLVCGLIMLTAGANAYLLLGVAATGLMAIIGLILYDPVRIKRVFPIFELNTANSLNSEMLSGPLYQVIGAISALKHGGILGQGLGHSVYKEHYIPEYHTDFILSMIGEELGIVGTSIVELLILTILVCGLYISYKVEHFQYRLLALGMTLQISLYAIVNTAVVCGLFPTKGLAMPFLSYGGSNLLSSFIAVGFILSVGRYVLETKASSDISQHDPSFWNV